MDEFELINHLFRQREAGAGVVLGPGDDGAILTPSGNQQLVMTMDTLVSGRHFPEDLPPFDIGWRSLAVNVSDLAAMGADPRWCLLSLSLPGADQHWLEAFCRGFYQMADSVNMTLVGGDMVHGQLQISVQATGEVPEGRALLRRGAQVGHRICIGGIPGEASVGLRKWQENERAPAAVERFVHPVPQVYLGKQLRDVASACIDISDGLLADLQHILSESGAPGAELFLSQLPASDLLGEVDADEALAAQLNGGDDYLLLFTLPVHQTCPLGCYEIGAVTDRAGIQVMDKNGGSLAIENKGWKHFG